MPKLDERVAAAALKLKQLKTQQQRAAARRRSIFTKNERSQEVRRNVLVGAIVRAKVESGEISKEDFRGWLDQAISRADDRELFELPVRDAE